MLKTMLLKIAKTPFMGMIVGTVFQYCSWPIPVKKVYNCKEIIVFYHPRPSYENHMIISPKRAVKNLRQMASDRVSKYFVKIWEATKDICVMHPEYNDSFVIVANGGKRQEVQQVHFHMFTNHEVVNEYSVVGHDEGVFYSDKNICILEHPRPNWEFHFVIKPIASSHMAENEEDRYFRNVLHSIDLLNVEFDIVQRGYSLVYQYSKQNSDREPVFHIVSGRKIEDNLMQSNKSSCEL